MRRRHPKRKRTGPYQLTAIGGSLLLCTAVAGCAGKGGGGGDTVRVSGSTTVNPVVADAGHALGGQGIKVSVDTQGGSAGGISQLGSGQIDVAMSSKPLSDADRKRFPKVDFVATEIGRDAVGIIIRRNVYESGTTSLSRDQLKRIFEGKTANWKEFGGPDLPVYVFDKEPGRGTREVLDKYLYQDGAAPPAPPGSGRYAIVGGNEETRTKLLTTPGSVAPLSSAFVEGRPELATVRVDGIELTPQNVAAKRYPLSRSLFLITNGKPAGNTRKLIDYVLSTQGQSLVTRHGYLNLARLGQR
ncbi:phosphate ABC transporter substrate-binding protein [Actinomadura macra]|uniref:phosphate ABC transporter substrate-binding protein n=1 Tax=Actinomadura macra TaxID=46164 RepID=UPI000A01D346|nr:phosphate ABC transporter substrate-binding protein [Actinomadura macra]